MPIPSNQSELIALALREDIGSGDITSEATIDVDRMGQAKIIAKEDFVVCGQFIADAVCRAVDEKLHYEAIVSDGTLVSSGSVIAQATGTLRGILTAERTLLNFLQRLSGVATRARSVVQLISHTKTKLLDTRKTTPGYRALEKYAVQIGGGVNHRHGLYDAFLVKNNHIDAVQGDIALAVHRCRELSGEKLLEVEARNQKEFETLLALNVDRILLDNMTPEQVSLCVKQRDERGVRVELEASGGITPQNARLYAETGVDFLSMGSLTHSARAVDISLRVIQD